MRNLFQGHLKGKKSRGGARERILATANVLQNKFVLMRHLTQFPGWLVISWETLELLEGRTELVEVDN